MELNKNKVNSKFKGSNNQGLTINDVEIKGIGNSSIELSENNIFFKSFQSNNALTKSINDIDFLIFSKGNFLVENKIFLGISGEQFEVSKKDNDFELEIFFDNLVKIKNNQYSENKTLNNDFNASNNQTSLNIGNNLENQESSKNNLNSEENIQKETINVSEEIRNFHNLMKDGIITEEEFEEKKKELLKL